jgi:PAS domain S-box-containing protein
MSNPPSASTRELVMRENDFIVSKTDPAGRITYGNQIFFEYSGYSEKEMLGAPHNLIRHPDMPRGVFKLLWDTLQSGEECFAYVKNLSKDGSFYWVFANVTADRDSHGNIHGYFSVRRKPKPAALQVVADIYQAMLQEERQAGPHHAMQASMAWLNNALRTKDISYEEFVLSL